MTTIPIRPKKPPRIPPTTGAIRLELDECEPGATPLVLGSTTETGEKVDVYVVRTYTVEPSDLVVVCEKTTIEGAGVITVVNEALDVEGDEREEEA